MLDLVSVSLNGLTDSSDIGTSSRTNDGIGETSVDGREIIGNVKTPYCARTKVCNSDSSRRYQNIFQFLLTLLGWPMINLKLV